MRFVVYSVGVVVCRDISWLHHGLDTFVYMLALVGGQNVLVDRHP